MTIQLFERRRDRYLISSDPSLFSTTAINEAFATKSLYWCDPLPESALQSCVDNSFCLGLYIQTATSSPATSTTPPKPWQIGLARLITDHTTFAYLTDVYVIEEKRGMGLGPWLIECVDEVLKELPYLRGAFLIAGTGDAEAYYKKNLGMQSIQQGKNDLVVMKAPGPANKLD